MKGKRLFLAALSASAALLLAACGGGSGSTVALSNGTSTPQTGILPQAESGVPFEIFSSALSQTVIDQPRTVVARDAEAWSRVWQEHTGVMQRLLPAVDFSRKMVIGVYLGASGACDGLTIDAVKRKEGPARLEVTWRHIPPPPNIACIATVVNHAVLITVPQSSLPVEFVQAAAPSSDLVVRTGWSFGMCLDKCEGTAEIRQDGATLRVKDRQPAPQPERAVWGAVSQQEWDTLLATFETLPDVTVGCPDCADEGREWIEVEHKGSRRRLDFSCEAPIAGEVQRLQASRVQQLQDTTRAIRSRLAVALGLPEFCNPGSIAFDRLEPSVFTSQIADKRFVTVRDAAAWSTLWNAHSGGRAPLPAVDFSQKMVAGVFMGGESIPCGSTSIESVRQRSNPDRIEVGYRVVDPGPVACIAAVINQYALVTLPASPLPVEFVRLPSP